MEKINKQTPDLTSKNIAKITELFPNVITEKEDENGRIVKAVDFDLLRQELSKDIVEGGDERYRLDWPGKRRSILKANTPINKTLVPDKESSVDFDNTKNISIEGDNFEVYSVLVGGSYTLRLGPTLTLEYYYNGAGCTDSIRNCFPPFNDSSFDDVLIRKNYILVQAFDTRIRNVFNVILRWIGDLDDGSSRSVGIVEYELNNHAKLFAVGDYFSGGPDTEFGSLLEYSLFVGAEYNF